MFPAISLKLHSFITEKKVLNNSIAISLEDHDGIFKVWSTTLQNVQSGLHVYQSRFWRKRQLFPFKHVA